MTRTNIFLAFDTRYSDWGFNNRTYNRTRKYIFQNTTGIKNAIKPNIREKAFQREYQAFLEMSDQDKLRYNGQFVVIYNGRVADSDINESELVSRFFKKNGNVRVYIDKIGGKEIIPIVRSPRKFE